MADPNGPRREVLGTYQMLWDCSYCGTKKLLGLTHKHCGECGAPQDPSRRYFPSDEDKVAVEDHKYHGADRSCPACRAGMSARARHCTQCGGPLEGAADVVRQQDQVARADPDFAALSARASGAAPRPSSSRWGRWLLLLLVPVAVLVGVELLGKRSAHVQVTGHTWVREIRIEDFDQRSAGSWCDQMPTDAYRIHRREKERSTREVPDGESCQTKRVDNGDGTFKEVRECTPRYRKEPVYDTWCDYQVDRWAYKRSVVARGGLAEAPAWPALDLRPCQRRGCEREAGRKETYTVHLADKKGGRTHDCAFPESLWRRFAVGDTYESQVSLMLKRLDCGKLQEQAARR
jgi:hypothetical protein